MPAQPRHPFPFPRKTIAQGDEITLEIELSLGDITETPSRVILLGQLQGMDPTAACVDLDLAMGGALLKLIQLRRAVHSAGELDIIPTGRHPVMAEMIAFLGLGQGNLFNEEVLASATHSALRGLLASHIDEFSTVLMGGRLLDGKTIGIEIILRYMLRGFTLALRDDPNRDRFRRIVIVEKNRKRLLKINLALHKLVAEKEFTGARVTLSASILPTRAREKTALLREIRREKTKRETSQLMLMMKPYDPISDHSELEVILYTGMASAAVVKKKNHFANTKITQLYTVARVADVQGVTTFKQLAQVSEIVQSLLPKELLTPLKELAKPRIELVHDKESSHLPWEALALPDGRYPALLGGFSRRFASERAAIIWPPKQADRLRILMVIDPSGDLSGARKEGQLLRDTLADHPRIKITYLQGHQANAADFKAILAEKSFDILHYAGHSCFNRENAKFSGLILHDEVYFTGADVLSLSKFPPVIIFNSCEAAQIYRRDPVVTLTGKDGEKIRNRDLAHGALSIAEAFLIAGIQQYVGTFWRVTDEAATLFGKTLYQELADGETIGNAVTAARKILKKNQQPDWANYIHYGNPDAIIFPKNSPQP